MTVQTIDVAFLQKFEQGLIPSAPEQSKIPAQVLGYGEVSTVFSIDAADPGMAYKRIPSFRSSQEGRDYVALYDDCMAVFAEIGIEIVPGKMVCFEGVNGRYTVIYLVQEKLDSQSIAHKVIHQLDSHQAYKLLECLFDEFDKVFDFNAENQGRLEVGLDGQLSNWAITGFDAESGNLPAPLKFVYLDTSSPLLRRDGVEQLDATIFLRSAPIILRQILEAIYVEDIVTRYYDLRKVTIDLLANLFKEQKSELVPDLLKMANERWAKNGRFQAITLDEIESYYKEDAFMWRLYLGSRRFDRAIHHLLRMPYPFILPGEIQR